jgi:hypothetical protein
LDASEFKTLLGSIKKLLDQVDVLEKKTHHNMSTSLLGLGQTPLSKSDLDSIQEDHALYTVKVNKDYTALDSGDFHNLLESTEKLLDQVNWLETKVACQPPLLHDIELIDLIG